MTDVVYSDIFHTILVFQAAKANVRLNTKRLYQSDGYAVQEILKGLSLLYSAIKNNSGSGQGSEVLFDEQLETTLNFDVSNKVCVDCEIQYLLDAFVSCAQYYDIL